MRVDPNKYGVPIPEAGLQRRESEFLYDEATTSQREELHEKFYDSKDYRAADFRMCARVQYYDFSKLTPFDARGVCAMCQTPVVYDRRATKDSLPKVCMPCAFRLYTTGLHQLAALGSWEPTDADVNDATMMARLQANMVENKKYGAVDPKRVLPNRNGLPQHDLRRGGVRRPKDTRSP